MNKTSNALSSIVIALVATQACSLDLKQGNFLVEAGVFSATQGNTQNININGLVGDRFNATKRRETKALIGLGYLLDGFEKDRFGIDFGINAFYLGDTQVSGTIDQELLFTNLAYSYQVSHLPVFAAAKAYIKTNSDKIALTLDAGIGPNFMETSQYRDWSIDGGVTLPDHAFWGRSKVTFSAIAGIGLKLTPLPGHAPLECGYRFFYLGQGDFNSRTNQIVNHLNTGNNHAQALVCTVTV